MLDDAERAELEAFRKAQQQDNQNSRILDWIYGSVVVAALLVFGSCTVGAYKSDAFFYHDPTGFPVGVDLMKTYCYLSGTCQVRHTPKALGVRFPQPSASAPSHGFETYRDRE